MVNCLREKVRLSCHYMWAHVVITYTELCWHVAATDALGLQIASQSHDKSGPISASPSDLRVVGGAGTRVCRVRWKA